ncbi:MAG TPA: tetratricopeptide repeat protein, partial [Polyangiales bacterium]|nr:tetratricopeptide repeat protein [Polyangiales bacterium]
QHTQSPTEQAALLREIASVRHDKLNDADGAVACLERAVALVPEDRQALLVLCDLYMSARRAQDAIAVLEKLIASYGGRRAKEVAVFEHRMGQAYEGLGLSNIALKHYDNAFKIDLTSVPVLRDLGRLCLVLGDLERAQKTYRALLLQRLGPEHGITKSDVYFRLGEISFRQGDKVKAKAMLERAISEAGQHREAQALLEQL